MPVDVTRFTNIVYGNKISQHKLDVYMPAMERRELFTNDRGKLPVIVSVHGGGWVHGSKDSYQFYCMQLARYGFAVINFSYRLAPQHKFPGFLHDTVQAFDWVYTYADYYGFDTDRVYAVGDSAGANILALYCEMGTNPAFARNFMFKANPYHIPRAVALNCGVYKTDMKQDSAHMENMQDGIYSDVVGTEGYYSERTLMNAVDYVTDTFPSAFVMTSTGDFLRPHAPLMVDALQRAHVPVVYRVYGDEEHKMDYSHVFHLNIRSHQARECNNEQIEFFREH